MRIAWTTTKTRRTTGGSLVRPSAYRILARGWIVVCWLLAALTAGGAEKGKKSQEPYALIAGTVFQESGFILRGAKVTVKPDPEAKPAPRLKNAKAVTDSRGEFAIRVPAAPVRYTVTVQAPGFRTQEKPVSISGDERVDLFFRLEPESK